MIPVTVLFEEATVACSVPCLDCFGPAVFRWRKADLPVPAKFTRRRCTNCAAAARSRKREAAAEAQRIRDRDLIERGRESERRRRAAYERKRRAQLASVPKRLRERRPPGPSA